MKRADRHLEAAIMASRLSNLTSIPVLCARAGEHVPGLPRHYPDFPASNALRVATTEVRAAERVIVPVLHGHGDSWCRLSVVCASDWFDGWSVRQVGLSFGQVVIEARCVDLREEFGKVERAFRALGVW